MKIALLAHPGSNRLLMPHTQACIMGLMEILSLHVLLLSY